MKEEYSTRDSFLRAFYRKIVPDSLFPETVNMAAYYCQAFLYELEKELIARGPEYVIEKIIKSIGPVEQGLNNNYDPTRKNLARDQKNVCPVPRDLK